MNKDQKQAIFDAVLSAVRTHAPLIITDIKIAIATTAALKIEEYFKGRADTE